MRTITTDFKRISQEKSLRSDYVYQELVNKRYASKEEYYTFDELFNVKKEKISYSDITGEFRYCQIGDVGKDGVAHPVKLNFDERNLLDQSYYKKIEKRDIMRVDENDILMSFLIPQDSSILGKFFKIGAKDKDILFSTAFLRLAAKRCPQILYYCLQSIFYKDLVSVARIKKGYTGYATLSEDDLKNMHFGKTIIDAIFKNQNELNQYISDIEAKTSCLASSILPIQFIIDKTFQREFGFDYDKFEEQKTHRTYAATQSLFSNNPDLRFSAKYHRPAGNFVISQLTGITDKKIKHYLAEPIVLGASISPSDFYENGTAYYVSMDTIKTFEVKLDDTKLVSPAYFESKKAKSLKKDDIILARSGVAIGKTAIVKEDFNGIFADFTMRIRLANYNPLFAYYYFRSTYFQYLIEVYKKGLQNQNIFPKMIQEFPIPDISLDEQQRIVNGIQSEIAKQDDVKNQIADLRNQIDEIILQAVRA